MTVANFDTVWAVLPYQYGADATEQVRLGWNLAIEHALPRSRKAPADPCGEHMAEGFVIDPCCPNCKAPAEGEGMDRDSLIALIMDETTDDIVAEGWNHLGKPNVLVQGCRYIRRNSPAGTDGYENPEASAKQFAGFIADRLLTALRARASEPEAGAVGEVAKIIMFGGTTKEVAWAKGKMPPVGTTLYTHPSPTTADKLRSAVEAFMPKNIDLTNTNLRDDLALPCDITVGEFRAIAQALAALPSKEGGV